MSGGLLALRSGPATYWRAGISGQPAINIGQNFLRLNHIGHIPAAGATDAMMVVMNIVEFLEARIAEEEANIRDGSFVGGPTDSPEVGSDDTNSLATRKQEECAENRAIIASWNKAADDEGIEDPSAAKGTVAVARRAMLTILAGSYRRHLDYDSEWSPDLPTAVPAKVPADCETPRIMPRPGH